MDVSDKRWIDAAADEFKEASHRFPDLTKQRWMELCRDVVMSGGGYFMSSKEKVKQLTIKVGEFLTCVPELHSYTEGDDDEGVDGGGDIRSGCLIPSSLTFDRTLLKSIPIHNYSEPAPYLDDLIRDWDLIIYLTCDNFIKNSLPSSTEDDWWAFAVMSQRGLCPVEEVEKPTDGNSKTKSEGPAIVEL